MNHILEASHLLVDIQSKPAYTLSYKQNLECEGDHDTQVGQ